jgi:hypothetical protein
LKADPLTQPEKAYVALMTLSIGITNMCDGYDVDDMNVLKFAPRSSDIQCVRGCCRQQLRSKGAYS